MVTTSEFLQYCTKTSTRQTYTSALRTYLRITLDTPIPKDSLNQKWILYLNSGRNIWQDLLQFPEKGKNLHLSPKTINLYLQVILLYLGDCGIIVEPQKLRRLRKRCPKNYPLTHDTILTCGTIQTLLQHADTRQRAEILIAVSSGVRIGELLRVTFDDIDLTTTPAEIHIPAAITKNETPRTTFISSEAAEALQDWLIVRKDRSSMRGKNPDTDNRIFPYSPAHESKKFQHLLKKSGKHQIDPNTRRSLIHFHSFRKFFLTEFKLAASAEVAEELAGHTGYLSGSYRRLSKQDMQEEYRKAEPRLTITTNASNTSRRTHPSYLHQEMQRITAELEQIQTEYRILCARISAESASLEE